MPLPQESPRPLLNPAEAAGWLGLSVGTLANWRSLGGGPPYTQLSESGPVRYAPEDLEAFVAVRRRLSTSDPGPEDQHAA